MHACYFSAYTSIYLCCSFRYRFESSLLIKGSLVCFTLEIYSLSIYKIRIEFSANLNSGGLSWKDKTRQDKYRWPIYMQSSTNGPWIVNFLSVCYQVYIFNLKKKKLKCSDSNLNWLISETAYKHTCMHVTFQFRLQFIYAAHFGIDLRVLY
jgi:hypothetical protein